MTTALPRNTALLCLSSLLLATLAGCGTSSGIQTQPAEATLPMAKPGITLYAAGDIADCRTSGIADSMAARTADLIAAGLATEPTAMVLTLGDNAYQTGSANEYAGCYEQTWGRFKSRTLPSPGNHEYYTKGATPYYDYFGALAGPQQRGYFSKDVGQWHLISLNSNLHDAAQQAQLDWLKDDLASHPTHCTLAFWHHPVFSSGGHGNNAQMRPAWQMLMSAGADLVLSGHDHDYERFAPQSVSGQRDDRHGMRQFVVGSGGAALTPLFITKSNSETVDNSSYGVIKLTLQDFGYAWEFMPVAGGTYHDGGSARCHGRV